MENKTCIHCGENNVPIARVTSVCDVCLEKVLLQEKYEEVERLYNIKIGEDFKKNWFKSSQFSWVEVDKNNPAKFESNRKSLIRAFGCIDNENNLAKGYVKLPISKSPQLGDTVKVISGGKGAGGATGKTGVIVDEPIMAGLKNAGGLRVKIYSSFLKKDVVWGLSKTAKVEIEKAGFWPIVLPSKQSSIQSSIQSGRSAWLLPSQGKAVKKTKNGKLSVKNPKKQTNLTNISYVLPCFSSMYMQREIII